MQDPKEQQYTSSGFGSDAVPSPDKPTPTPAPTPAPDPKEEKK